MRRNAGSRRARSRPAARRPSIAGSVESLVPDDLGLPAERSDGRERVGSRLSPERTSRRSAELRLARPTSYDSISGLASSRSAHLVDRVARLVGRRRRARRRRPCRRDAWTPSKPSLRSDALDGPALRIEDAVPRPHEHASGFIAAHRRLVQGGLEVESGDALVALEVARSRAGAHVVGKRRRALVPPRGLEPVAQRLLVERRRARRLPPSAGQTRDESGVSTSSASTSRPSTNPSSSFVSATMIPRASRRAAARCVHGEASALACSAISPPTSATASSNEMFSSCVPLAAFVDGVNTGCGEAL